MKEIHEKDRFTAPMYRQLWLPAMFSSFGWALSDMADAVVVGQKLGTTGLTSISLILPIYMINCTLAHGLGLGGSVRYATAMSKGQKEQAENIFSSVLSLALICSVLTAIAGFLFIEPLLSLLGTTAADGALFQATKEYLEILILSTPLFYLSNLFNYFLRNDSHQKLAGVGSVVGNLCDIVFNVLLVLVFGLGTRGAALSTTLGQIVAIAIYSLGLISKEHHLHLHTPKKASWKVAWSCFWAGTATSVQYFYQMIFFLVCNNVLIRMSGETGVAVFDVIQNTSYLILYLYEGTARAMQPLYSTYYGEYNLIGRKSVTKLGFCSGIFVGSLLILFVEMFPQSMCMLFGIAGNAAQATAMIALRVYGFGAFFAGINILLCNYYQSHGQEQAAFVIETLRGIALLVPLTFVFAGLGIETFWWLFPATEVGTLVIFCLINRIRQYRILDIAPERVFQYTIESNTEALMELTYRLETFCEQWEADMKQQYFVTMTVEELGMLILTKGIQNQTDGYIQITVIALENGKFELHMRDNGVSFNPFLLETARVSEQEDVNMDAIGVLVVKQKAEEFFYQRYQGFNSLVLKI